MKMRYLHVVLIVLQAVNALLYAGEESGATGTLNATFQQPIDHGNPALGNFSQFYFYNTTYWKGEGSPIILYTTGESPQRSIQIRYLTDDMTTGLLAKRIGAAIVVVEHRYFGAA